MVGPGVLTGQTLNMLRELFSANAYNWQRGWGVEKWNRRFVYDQFSQRTPVFRGNIREISFFVARYLGGKNGIFEDFRRDAIQKIMKGSSPPGIST